MEELGQVNTYPDIFEDGDFFSLFRNKVGKGGGGSPRSIFESFSPVHVKTLKRWKYDSIPYRACVMLVEYDLYMTSCCSPLPSVHTYKMRNRHF